jgi:hypothetical protein
MQERDRWSCRAQQFWRFADLEMKYEGYVSGGVRRNILIGLVCVIGSSGLSLEANGKKQTLVIKHLHVLPPRSASNL